MKNLRSLVDAVKLFPDLLKSVKAKTFDKRRVYKFRNGLKCFQEELDLAQDEKIADLVFALPFDSVESFDKMTIKDVVLLLINNKILYDLLKAVLIPSDPKTEITDEIIRSLKNSELEAVIKDFFIFNPSAKQLSKIFVPALTGTKTSSK